MAYHSDYDFVGGYDHREHAGLLHVADHHISPGKKQWTWGCGDFGEAWDRNLTDEDGPYIELMTGCFTDNQPDFSWLAPYEEKEFTQYFMPYKQIGVVKNATVQAAVNLELEGTQLTAAAYATGDYSGAKVVVKAGAGILVEKVVELSPRSIFTDTFEVDKGIKESDCSIEVYDATGDLLVAYRPREKAAEKLPQPATAVPSPEEARTTEDLYLYGQHLEQYRHATFEPEDYYKEGIRRDATDIRLNNAYGALLMRRGLFKQAQPFFEAAVKKMTRSNPNPYDGEPLYNLGLCLQYQGELSKAYDAFYKASWNGAWQSASFYHLACIAAGEQLTKALDFAQRAIVKNGDNMKARGLKTTLLRKLGRTDEMETFARESLRMDCMDFISLWELALAGKEAKSALLSLIDGNYNNIIELSLEYMGVQMFEEAAALLGEFIKNTQDYQTVSPMIYYHMGYAYHRLGDWEKTKACLVLAKNACSDYCFPHRLEDIIVLEYAAEYNPQDGKAPYYLGCLWYDKKQYRSAVCCWERSRELDGGFPTVHRNLALAYYNKHNDSARAKAEMERAFSLDPSDARVLMELDQLRKKLGIRFAERLMKLDEHFETVCKRDNLFLEYAALQNAVGNYEAAMKLIDGRKFHPWEGGEGKVPAQYVLCRVELARRCLANEEYDRAIGLLVQATVYPHNLGEGKLSGAQENNLYYYMGCAYEQQLNDEKAKESFEKASTGLTEPAGVMYYNDQPPETIYYQGLALLKLGREPEARSRFHTLIAYGKRHLFEDVKIDFFAVSLPDMQIFDEDLNKKNRVHCLFMMGLGYLGLGELDEAKECLTEAVKLDSNHIGAIAHLEGLR
ncbi:MAG: DUF5107 domain-containing protein [Acetanaerobacterium sp.]